MQEPRRVKKLNIKKHFSQRGERKSAQHDLSRNSSANSISLTITNGCETKSKICTLTKISRVFFFFFL